MVFTSALVREGMHQSLVFLVTNHSCSPSSTATDPLVSYGRHFGRTIHALANIKVLFTNGILRLGELAEEAEESFTIEYV